MSNPNLESRSSFDPRELLEHDRVGNRKFDHTDEEALYRITVNFEAQLAELGLKDTHYEYDEEGNSVRSFDYVKPEAVSLILRSLMTGKFPQPTETGGSMFFSDRTAIGRQSALDTFLERVKAQQPYEIEGDPDFYFEPEVNPVEIN